MARMAERDSSEYDVHKVVLFGSGDAGKSQLTLRFMYSEFVEDYEPGKTDSYRKKVVVRGKECQIDILDSAGQEDYAVVRNNYIRSGDGFLCVFSLVDRETFAAAIDFRDIILKVKADEQTPIILVGTNLDLCDEEGRREVQRDEAEFQAASFGTIYFETSAKHYINVDEVFYSLLDLIVQRKTSNRPSSGKRENKHVKAVQKAMEMKGRLDHTIVHGVFVGLARSGKNSIMERLLGEMPSSVSPSTGVAENVVHVKVEKSSTVATNIGGSFWSRMEYDLEAIKFMLICSDPSSIIAAASGGTPSAAVCEQSQSTMVKHTSARNTPGPLGLIKKAMLKKKAISPIDILKNASRNRDISALQGHFKTSWSLYLTNTGGQIEFQEVLPLLVSGPSVFFYIFRLDRDLNTPYVIEYDHPDRVGVHPYTSSFTIIEGILQTLATIASMGTFIYKGMQKEEVPLRPKVFFIGTHKDKLDSMKADSTIASIDQQLQEVIKSTSHYENLIEYASTSRLIFAVNNFSESDLEFHNIRSAVEHVVERDQFQMTSPVHWLIYSLALRKLKHDVISFDKCFEVAKQCGITTREELDEALYFIHSKMGLIRYFPYEGVKDLVVINPQFLFDKVTDLIVDTFTFEKAGKQLTQSFKQKGIFSLSEFEKISSRKVSKSIITPFQFGLLLEQLRIMAPFQMSKKRKYFFPCALAHAHAIEKTPRQSLSHTSPQLLIAFECGYCPKGLAGALIKYLMVNEMESKTSWLLQTDTIYRNEVSFNVGPYDTVILRILPTHFEINCIRDPQFTEHRDWPIENTCSEVLNAVESGIKQILKDFSYVMVQHHLAFPCQADGCTNQGHPASLLYGDGIPKGLWCDNTKKRFVLPPNFHLWSIGPSIIPTASLNPSLADDQREQRTSPLQTSSQQQSATPNIPDLLRELYTKVPDRWEDIGIMLGIVDELQQIKADYPADCRSCLREMLKVWLKRVNPPPSWKAIAEALNFVGEDDIAELLKSKYCI